MIYLKESHLRKLQLISRVSNYGAYRSSLLLAENLFYFIFLNNWLHGSQRQPSNSVGLLLEDLLGYT
jgi:hypothetical protein